MRIPAHKPYIHTAYIGEDSSIFRYYWNIWLEKTEDEQDAFKIFQVSGDIEILELWYETKPNTANENFSFKSIEIYHFVCCINFDFPQMVCHLMIPKISYPTKIGVYALMVTWY